MQIFPFVSSKEIFPFFLFYSMKSKPEFGWEVNKLQWHTHIDYNELESEGKT